MISALLFPVKIMALIRWNMKTSYNSIINYPVIMICSQNLYIYPYKGT